MSAHYLLRIDDLCPTHDRTAWQRVWSMCLQTGIRPILAIVPENHDPELMRSAPDAEFWNQMRSAQRAGATIAMHGYQHVCNARGRSLLPLHHRSEFAGRPFADQTTMIARGIALLRGQNLPPKLFIAPRHGFDANTLRALYEDGIGFLSDGFARRAHMLNGIVCIPQQLWAPRFKRAGLWTLCVHPNSEANLPLWADFLARYAHAFVSFEDATAIPPASLTLVERILADAALIRVRARHTRRRAIRRMFAREQ